MTRTSTGQQLGHRGAASRQHKTRKLDKRSTISDVFQTASPAVVQLFVQLEWNVPFAGVVGNWLHKNGIMRCAERMGRSGSGCLVRPYALAPVGGKSATPLSAKTAAGAQAYVLTNYHVICGGEIQVQIECIDGFCTGADVVGTSPLDDLAVLRLHEKRPHQPAFLLRRSRDLRVGESVASIGYPFGLGQSLKTGVVSGLHRQAINVDFWLHNLIQTDLSLNEGESGGPMLTLDGQIAGIQTATYHDAACVSVAVPVARAERLLAEVLSPGEVQRPYFGFEPEDLPGALHASLPGGRQGLASPGQTYGARVKVVEAGAPADGVLQEGDVILTVQGARVMAQCGLRLALADCVVGAPVALTVRRGDRNHQLTIVPVQQAHDAGTTWLQRRHGLGLTQVAPFAADPHLPPDPPVVRWVQPRSTAARAGLACGDLILAVNAEKTASKWDLTAALARHCWSGQLHLLVQRHDFVREVFVST